MNSKFFDLNKKKQDRIINAALQIFAENGYRQANTEEIVKLAEISKGLLFHYFISKMGLYEFLVDYSIKYITMELNTTINKEEKNYFSIEKQVELVKFHVMKQFPYMILFVKTVPQESKVKLEDTFASIYKQADYSKYGKQFEIKRLHTMVTYILEGVMQEQVKQPCFLPEQVYTENAAYLDMLQNMFSIYSSCK